MLPHWRRPAGVAPGTWDYVNDRTIADRYDAFVADTPLCRFDQDVLSQVLPGCETRQEVVLDLGCGSGRTALPLAARGYSMVGIDLSQSMLRVLKAKPVAGAGLVMPIRANLVQLDCLADRTADHAVCLFSTLGMVQGRIHRRQVLRHAARIVRPGGSFLVHVHHRWAALREPGGVGQLVRSWWRSRGSSPWDFGDSVYAYRGLGSMFLHRFSRSEIVHDLIDSRWQPKSIWSVRIDGGGTTGKFEIPGGFLVHAILAAEHS
jgi:SAM-dependent methyltransferase